MKEEALKLADEIDNFLKEEEQLPWGTKQVYLDMASTMIRRLVEELDRLNYDLKSLAKRYKALDRTKPLSDKEIGDCVDDYFGLMALQHKYIYDIDQVQEYGLKLSRAIEERHGIK